MFGTELMGRLSLALCLFLYFTDVYGEPVVDLYPGQLRGTTITTRNGRNISAFLGIPYANPPVGPLRFKSPQLQRLLYRQTDLQADVDGNRCPQLNDDGEVVGDEDCLYLNVYTPEVFPEALFPTMVYFHGGNFVRGSGSSTDAGPEYLLDKDIVLVTVNYRLGALGFLSTRDAAAPGNFGLKDQTVALQWVRRNIPLFGGAPQPTTIFGQGAGGVSTSLLATSERSRDLFDRYISQSGNAMSFWAERNEDQNYYNRSRRLGEHLNCPIDNSWALVNCLRNVDVSSLVEPNDVFEDPGDTPWLPTTWVPTIEPRVEDAFLTQFPLHQILMRGIKNCPSIIGDVRNEGLILTADLYANDTLYDRVAGNLTAFMKTTIRRYFEIRYNPYKLFQNFYFDGISSADKELLIRNMTNFVTDAEFRRASDMQARIAVNTVDSPLYYYTFDYRGSYSKTSAIIGNNDDVGVDHGDDLIYLFPIKEDGYKPSESDEKMIDIMVDFWTTFALTGIPTSQYTADPNVWEPYVDFGTPSTLHIGGKGDPENIRMRQETDGGPELFDVALAKQMGEFLSLG